MNDKNNDILVCGVDGDYNNGNNDSGSITEFSSSYTTLDDVENNDNIGNTNNDERRRMLSTNDDEESNHHHDHQEVVLMGSSSSSSISSSVSSSLSSLSFIIDFMKLNGPPQIILLMMLIAIASGSTIGIIPAVMSDRYARINHGYNDDLNCADYGMKNDNNEKPPMACIEGSNDAQNVAAIGSLISNGLTFITSSLIGSLSDEYGRKGILIIGITIGILGPISLLLLQLISSMNPIWYYICNSLSGLVNWNVIALSTLNDVLPPELRAPGIGLLFGSLLLGIAMAPSISLFLNHIHISIISVLLSCLGLLLTIFYLPETLSKEIADETKKRRLLLQQQQREEEELTNNNNNHNNNNNTFIIIIRKMKYYFKTTILLRPINELLILNRNNFFRIISLLAFFSGIVTSSDSTLILYYIEQPPLNFNDSDISKIFLILGIFGLLSQIILLKPFCEYYGEKFVLIVCFLLSVLHNILIGIARSKSTIYIAEILSSISTMTFPIISAMKSNNVDESEQGRIQGALYSLTALASGIGPTFLRYIEHCFQNTIFGPGIMFIVAGGINMIAVIGTCFLPNDKANSSSIKKKQQQQQLLQQQQEQQQQERVAGEEEEQITTTSTTTDLTIPLLSNDNNNNEHNDADLSVSGNE